MRETKYWTLSVACALVVLVLLGLHMAIMHLPGLLERMFGLRGSPLAWQSLLDRGRDVFFTWTYVLALAAGLFHGLYGVHNALTEVWSGERASRRIGIGCWVAGIVLFAVGTCATVLFHFGVAA